MVLLRLPIATTTLAVRDVAASLAATVMLKPVSLTLVTVHHDWSLSAVHAPDAVTVTALLEAAEVKSTEEIDVVKKSNGSIISSSISISRLSF